MRKYFKFFQDNISQDKHYKHLVEKRLPQRSIFTAGYYERFDPFLLDNKPFMVEVYNEIFSQFFHESARNLLDVGCGTGLYWPVLSKYCDHIIGVDFSETMIAEARRLIEVKSLKNVKAFVQNGEKLDFPAGSFDTILCMDVLHHIPDIKSAIRNFHYLLKPGGRLLAVEPNTCNPLMFIVHLIPREERLAIIRNYAPVLRKLFSPYFKNIRFHYINYIASAASENQLKRLKLLGKFLTAVPFLRTLCLRQIIIMERG